MMTDHNLTWIKSVPITLFLLAAPFLLLGAEPHWPVLGAQVLIEPAQNHEEIEHWFNMLQQAGMTFCRIRLFEEHIHQADGNWDFSIYEKAFEAAEQHGVQIFATLFPTSSEPSVGGFKFPESEPHLRSIAQYIQKTVEHFKNFPALYGWVVMNEPGADGQMPANAFAHEKFSQWQQHQFQSLDDWRHRYLPEELLKQRFLRDYITWYLAWLANEIRKYDSQHDLHVNSHMIFSLAREFDFPDWRQFLTSLGASAHPSWHFGYFHRNQYAVALAANADLVRSGAGPLPFWFTELQGGNNTYSGFHAFCPTADEIIQWVWLAIAGGSRGIIFWSLNPRSHGPEAGEWALLNFQNQPSDRLLAAKKVANCLQQNQLLFENARPLDTGIHILYSRESLWIERLVQLTQPGEENLYEGRLPGGVMKSCLAFYECLSELGLNVAFQEMGEFDFDREDHTGSVLILANQIAVPSWYWEKLTRFVQNGGRLIVEGLTAFYDENMASLMKPDFPLRQVFGGVLQEVKCQPGDFRLPGFAPGQFFPVHLWKSTIHNENGQVMVQDSEGVLAIRTVYGRGETIWYPSLLALGARRNDNRSLASWLRDELEPVINKMPVTFKKQQQMVLMKTMASLHDFITVLCNKSQRIQKIDLSVQQGLVPEVLFKNQGTLPGRSRLQLPPEETMVIKWSFKKPKD
ncbi:MAG: beta-galactosidase [candidate division KSB1 bacterium]|nr:beta-galactosidase [candidate division KSB1 bacterium]